MLSAEELHKQIGVNIKDWYSMPVFTSKTFRVNRYDEQSESYVFSVAVEVFRFPGAFTVKLPGGNDTIVIPVSNDRMASVGEVQKKTGVGVI